MKNVRHSTFNLQGSRMALSGARPTPGVGRWVLDVPGKVLIFTIRLYRWTISPALSLLFGPTGGCRFTPSCSQYAVDAIHSRGALAGGWLAVKRICRCHPWGNCGHDPVPEKGLGVETSEFRI